MSKNSFKIAVTILAMSMPISSTGAQGATSVPDEITGESNNKSRFVTTSKDLGEVLRYNGFEFETDTVEGKDVLVVDVDGITTVMQFYGDAQELDSVQFYAGFTGDTSSTIQRMNEWNSMHRFTRAYIDLEGDPVLEMDINFAFGGVSERQLEDSLALWELSVVTFRKFIYSKDKPHGDATQFIKTLRGK